MKGKMITISVFTVIASIVFYCSILFQPMYFFEFEALPILLFSAEALLIISIILIASAILISKGIFDGEKIKKKIIGVCVFIVVGCSLLVGYNALAFYDGYTPERYTENNREYTQTLFPYHNITGEDYERFDISASYITGTKYFWLESYGVSVYGMPQGYDVRYFESISPFMNFKFRMEIENPLVKDWAELRAVSQGEVININGKDVIFFEEDGDYGILVKDFNKSTYATLTNTNYTNMTKEEFASEVLKQHEELKHISESNAFFDVPFSDIFN
ncbi:MAG: hypothetical protein E7556_08320 [Ruminococcaceae bacterium]|nr:hypothetical protein [Oscillospiraceae bacterium]